MRTTLGTLRSLLRRGGLALAVLLALSGTSEAAPITYAAYLSGPNEAPPNASPGTGYAVVTLDTVAHTLSVEANFSDLIGTTSASHIHCCTAVPLVGTAGVATVTPSFTGFPLGVQSGTYSHTFDTSLASAWNNAFITANGGTPLGAEAALALGLAAGEAYFNIHTSVFPGGEIRGFLTPVPEPSSILLLGSGALALARRLRRRAVRG